VGNRRYVDKALAFQKAERWPGVKTMQEALREVTRELGGSVDVTAPRSSRSVVSIDRDMPTLATPSHAPPDHAGSSHSGSLSTAITSSSYAPTTSMSPQRGRLGVVLALVVAAALVAIFALRSRDGGTTESAAATPVQSEPSAPRSADAPAAIEPSPPSAAPIPEPVASTPTPVVAGAAPSRTKVPPRARPDLPPARSAAPAPAGSPTSPPRPASDPLERRY
jgi:hypothetical protein